MKGIPTGWPTGCRFGPIDRSKIEMQKRQDEPVQQNVVEEREPEAVLDAELSSDMSDTKAAQFVGCTMRQGRSDAFDREPLHQYRAGRFSGRRATKWFQRQLEQVVRLGFAEVFKIEPDPACRRELSD